MRITVYFATNRERASGGGFGTSGDKLRSGTAAVDITPQDTIHGARMNDFGRYVPEELNIADDEYDEEGNCIVRGIDAIFSSLIDACCTADDSVRRSILLVVAGYNNSFEDSIETGAALANQYGSDEHELVPFVFSWPSDGNPAPSGYRSDQRDAENSGSEGAMVLQCFLEHLLKEAEAQLTMTPCLLFTHSMGAYVLSFALKELVKSGGAIYPVFDTAVMAAPDVDADALENPDKLRPIERLAQQVVVYVHARDTLLKVATSLNNSPRLGHHGPARETRRDFAVPLTTVRCLRADNFFYRDNPNHWYYRNSIATVNDIKEVLNGAEGDEIAFRTAVSGKSSVYRLTPPQKYYDAGRPRHDHESDGP